jgi:hypothetical protein
MFIYFAAAAPLVADFGVGYPDTSFGHDQQRTTLQLL